MSLVCSLENLKPPFLFCLYPGRMLLLHVASSLILILSHSRKIFSRVDFFFCYAVLVFPARCFTPWIFSASFLSQRAHAAILSLVLISLLAHLSGVHPQPTELPPSCSPWPSALPSSNSPALGFRLAKSISLPSAVPPPTPPRSGGSRIGLREGLLS